MSQALSLFEVCSRFIEELDSMSSMRIVNGWFGDFVKNGKERQTHFSLHLVSTHMYGMNMGQRMSVQSGKILQTEYFRVRERFKYPDLIVGFILGNGDKRRAPPRQSTS